MLTDSGFDVVLHISDVLHVVLVKTVVLEFLAIVQNSN
jgi:hypothetical protein